VQRSFILCFNYLLAAVVEVNLPDCETSGAHRIFQRGGGSDKVSKQKWPILLLQRSDSLVSSKFDWYYWFEPEWMLSRDSCMAMSAISNIAFGSIREGFRLPKPLPWVRPCLRLVFGHVLDTHHSSAVCQEKYLARIKRLQSSIKGRMQQRGSSLIQDQRVLDQANY